MSNWAVSAGHGPTRLRPYDTTKGGSVALGTAVTAHVKEGWVEVCAATPHRAAALLLSVFTDSGTAGAGLLDVGVGAAGAEQVLVGNVFYRVAGFRNNVTSVLLPVPIPAGTRLSVRRQASSTNASSAVYVNGAIVAPHPLQPQSLRWLGTVGVNEAATELASCAQSYGVVGTTWTELVAATPSRVRAVIPQYGGAAGAETFSLSGLFVIGAGAAGAEEPQIEALPWCTFGGPPFGALQHGPFATDFPVGVRLSAAVYANATTANHQVGLLLFG